MELCCASLCFIASCAVRNGPGKPVPRQVTADGVLYGKRVKDLSQLANDDELAAEEAEAQGGIPGESCSRLDMRHRSTSRSQVNHAWWVLRGCCRWDPFENPSLT
jgi:hypothetical protein